MKIFFYMPEAHLPSPERQAAWLSGNAPQLLSAGKSASAQSWLYQTWLELRETLPVELVTSMPSRGTVITMGNFLTPHSLPSDQLFIANIVADFIPHPGTHFQIVQNRAHSRRLPRSRFIPHWPQPNLIPRPASRAGQFETVAFFGDPKNIASELATDSFASTLAHATGTSFEIRNAAQWHDYSNVDVALAIRDFSNASHLNKPATKLYNAWLAGVPLIGGRDSAFSAEGIENENYLFARSPNHCIELVQKLKADPAFRAHIVASGHKKTATRSREAVREIWKSFCENDLPHQAERWAQMSRPAKSLFWLSQQVILFFDRKIRS